LLLVKGFFKIFSWNFLVILMALLERRHIMATGHIRKRNSGGYQITIELGNDPLTGKRRRQSKTVHTTKKQAEAIMRQMIQDIESGHVAAPSTRKLQDWITDWLDNYRPNIEETTRDGYQEKLDNYIIPGLGKIPLNTLQAEHIQKWVNDLSQRGLSPKTIRNAFNILNPALKKAVVLHMIPSNPCEGVELPKLVRPEVEVYDSRDFNLILDAAKGTDMYLIVLLELTVGLRRGELIALKWPQVDLDSGVLHIRENTVRAHGTTITKQPKSKAGNRDISIGSEVVEVLRQAKAEYDRDKMVWGAGFHDGGYVIRQENGEPFRPDSITHKWRRFETKHGLSHIKFHGLRHSNATALIQAGVSPKVVQQRLGHADVTITLNTYTHVLPSMDQDAANKLDSMVFSTSDSR